MFLYFKLTEDNIQLSSVKKRGIIMEKTCFVIMGFKTKKIPNTNIKVNLDDTYDYLIKPALIKSGVISVFSGDCHAYRCDEIFTTQAINETFIKNLYTADIVIADITALNQNAIYELGMRHAMKPKSTIIMCDKETLRNNNFFDLTFNPHITYDSGCQKNLDEIKRIENILLKTIETCKNSGEDYIDSPVFSYGVYKNNIVKMHKQEDSYKDSLRSLINEGNYFIETELYEEAESIYKQIIEKSNCLDNDIICSYILAMYKKELSFENLSQTLDVLKKYIKLDTTTCENALGIAASINLKLFSIKKEEKFLYSAIEYYRKGSYYESGNLYCAKNYCSTLLKIYQVENNLSVLKEYYYTAVHNAKFFLSHSQVIKRKSAQYDDTWFMSNQNDLFFIAFNFATSPYKIIYNSTRQKNTIECGRLILEDDMHMLQKKIGKI